MLQRSKTLITKPVTFPNKKAPAGRYFSNQDTLIMKQNAPEELKINNFTALQNKP